ncbi:receptor tyrosine-protein kinase erbB-3b isoform X2 [Neoarius graeffei]|uniref:receptor tyrosine-protein kinase erbB-3b isoform X2 n=1 Tax=Neoarius graeffei TaxID=443677 RepID=UPI00298C965F|nr:receptor tyrosine-protein kinase erbB-3b isoform X2 [Neoarius graeffei]
MRLHALTLLLLSLQEAAVQTQEACPGTKNGLSFTESPGQHYNNLKEHYNGCEIIIGNLEITLMQRDFDFSFLETVREVTGYVLIATNQFRRLPLEQLRVIRGSMLYDKEWALSVFLNFDDQYGLVDLGLTHLTEILVGGVQIINNKYLSYAPWINWQDIVRDNNARVEISNNGEKALCHPGCGGYCWGPNKDQCQILTKTVCAPQCHGRCFGPSPQHCCNIECAGGCAGPKETDCFACQHVRHLGACVSHCPQPHIYNKHTFQLEPNPDAMYQYGSICLRTCPAHFVVDGSACVSACPPDKTEVEKNGTKHCEPCNGLCPKVCEGTDPSQSHRQTVDSSNIDSFINCTKIQGSLHFLVMGINGDMYNNIPPLDPEKLRVFSTVREITGILSIQSWPAELKDLSFFSNLTTIRGRSLHLGSSRKRPFSLLVMKVDSLTSLGLRSLREISEGSVYISNNTNLCYQHTLKWQQIFTGNQIKRRRNWNDIKFNRPASQCEAEGHVCDPLCSNSGCWGPGPDQCLFCRNHSRHNTCIAQCNIFSGEPREFAGSDGECRACHPECLKQEGQETCKGEGADKCEACSHLMDGPHCVPSCPYGVTGERGQTIFKYPDNTGQCQPCHPNCTSGCTGPSLRDCMDGRLPADSPHIAAIVSGVLAGLFVCLAVVVMALLYRRGVAIRRKRALRRYLESSESIEPLDPGEKGTKVHARILKSSELRKSKLLGSGVFGTVHKGFWIPEGDSVKIPVAIKTIQDRSGHHNFTEITDHMLSMGSLDHPYIVRLLGICPGQSLQLVTQLSTHGSLLQHLRQNANNLDPQRLLNWCVQIAKGMYYLEEHRMVHRNLAARNVLLKSDYIVQVSDFGVADLLYPDDKKYVYKTPIKWMALESILFRRYTHQSDVWSYGVTVWEMMSHGAEPYTSMHPNDVPGLLEKGERLAQPQICTIDVYMVMVKCWMIDENIRPTFKELANEFTRMARDPPRYLVVKKDQNSAATEESHLRDPKLIESDLESEDDEVLDDGFATPPLQMSPTRSHSRMRMGSYRSASSGQSVLVGYLPMTANAGDDLKQLWSQRKRQGSARTTSESSEGRCTMLDMEMCEILSQTGSLCRGRSRGDSAYLSNCVSVTSDPLSPGIEMAEEDRDGYILPRSAHNSGRDPLVTQSSSRGSLRHNRASKNGKSQSHAIPDQSQEYELMSKQPVILLHSPGDGNINGSANLPISQQSPCDDLVTCSNSLSPHKAVQTQNDESEDRPVPVPEDNDGASEKEPCGDNSDIGTALEEGQPQQAVVEYEYMDIRNESTLEKNNASSHEPRETGIYQNTHEFFAPKMSNRRSCKADEDAAITEQPDEYEDMNPCGTSGVCTSGVRLEYQNFPANGRMVSGEEPHRVKMRAFRNTCAGVDEKNSNTSFDNPDYWHSRLFHKPDAVCT